MEISGHLNIKQVPLFSSTSFSQNNTSKFNSVSCRASTMETQSSSSSSSSSSSANLYEKLSLKSEKVGFDEIRKAYRNMARQYHPDVVPLSKKEESTKKFVELQQAYEILSDPVSREKYDHELGLGLGYLSGYGVKGMRSGEMSFDKERWEEQLEGLKSRSHARKGKKKWG
ncbi:hypothetical protein ACHQM5_022400 [Ranunculus cassubicifolius]